MKKFEKMVLTLSLFSTMILTTVASAFASYGGTAMSGKIWPPVLTGWKVVSSQGNSSIDWIFSDPKVHPISLGIPDLSSTYSDWNQPNNIDIVMWAQNHHIQTPLNSVFYWTPVLPTDVQPSDYTGPIPCSYTPQILSIIESSGYSPADFFAAGKAPLSGSTPTPSKPVQTQTKSTEASTPAQQSNTTETSTQSPTSTHTSTPTSVPAPKVSIPAPKVASPQVPVVPQVAQAEAQKHADPEQDPNSMVSATVTKLDNAKQAAKEQADTNAYNWKLYGMIGVVGLIAIICLIVVVMATIRKRRG